MKGRKPAKLGKIVKPPSARSSKGRGGTRFKEIEPVPAQKEEKPTGRCRPT